MAAYKNKRLAFFSTMMWFYLIFSMILCASLKFLAGDFLHVNTSSMIGIFLSVILALFMVDKVLPKEITKDDIIAMAKDLQEQMNKIKAENEQLSKQLKGETPNDETFINIVNETIDYLHNSPEEEIVSIRGYLLYVYQGNNEKIKESIRHLSPNSPKLQQVNIYGGNNIVQPNATTGVQHITKDRIQ